LREEEGYEEYKGRQIDREGGKDIEKHKRKRATGTRTVNSRLDWTSDAR